MSYEEEAGDRAEIILVVDDTPFMLRTLTFILEKGGYAAETASSGREALEKARSLRPRLILLDAVLPDMDGRQVFEEIRSYPELAGTRVVMVSGREREELPRTDGYIQKPFRPDVVWETVAAMLKEEP